MIHVENITESQLDDHLGRKKRKWIWDLCSIIPMAQTRMMNITVKTKDVENVKSVIGKYDYLFSHF